MHRIIKNVLEIKINKILNFLWDFWFNYQHLFDVFINIFLPRAGRTCFFPSVYKHLCLALKISAPVLAIKDSSSNSK